MKHHEVKPKEAELRKKQEEAKWGITVYRTPVLSVCNRKITRYGIAAFWNIKYNPNTEA